MPILLRANCESIPLGPYPESRLERDFGEVLFCEGLQRVQVVKAAGAPSGRAFVVGYPRGAVGPRVGGAQWRVRLKGAHHELFAAYSLCFSPGFDFVKGGKLPGLVGGNANTGGQRPNGRDGFSARMMWRSAGQVVQYVYHPDQVSIWGDDMDYDLDGPVRFEPGRWYRVQHHLVLNTPGNPGARDGQVQGFLDGKLCLDRRNLRFRDSASLFIDQFYFSTFFGGNEPDWAPVKDESLLFDDFCVATSPIVF